MSARVFVMLAVLDFVDAKTRRVRHWIRAWRVARWRRNHAPPRAKERR